MSAANGTYRLGSIYIGFGEVLWAYRAINVMNARNEVRRIVEQGIPEGPFRIRLAGLAGTSTMKVHRVTAYQLADIVPPGALGHHVDALATPVRVVNGPFSYSSSSTALAPNYTSSDTFTSLSAGAVGTGSNRFFYKEHCHIQALFSGDQPFTWWL